MSIATYRGVKYDTKEPEKDSTKWLELVALKTKTCFTYRGLNYSWRKIKNV